MVELFEVVEKAIENDSVSSLTLDLTSANLVGFWSAVSRDRHTWLGSLLAFTGKIQDCFHSAPNLLLLQRDIVRELCVKNCHVDSLIAITNAELGRPELQASSRNDDHLKTQNLLLWRDSCILIYFVTLRLLF